ncbi:MAG: uncharacterized protein KVP18_002116 [Porospora cf. gigantea A]|uniref:uncharacterized protein n=1 Tax=Porospora cf. gigantea A TaxID=2853593 RepID=UPI003559B653|nr:MAG: hypothetical protein KVP18_002116 [Porospora cf. gigantea A]
MQPARLLKQQSELEYEASLVEVSVEQAEMEIRALEEQLEELKRDQAAVIARTEVLRHELADDVRELTHSSSRRAQLEDMVSQAFVGLETVKAAMMTEDAQQEQELKRLEEQRSAISEVLKNSLGYLQSVVNIREPVVECPGDTALEEEIARLQKENAGLKIL